MAISKATLYLMAVTFPTVDGEEVRFYDWLSETIRDEEGNETLVRPLGISQRDLESYIASATGQDKVNLGKDDILAADSRIVTVSVPNGKKGRDPLAYCAFPATHPEVAAALATATVKNASPAQLALAAFKAARSEFGDAAVREQLVAMFNQEGDATSDEE